MIVYHGRIRTDDMLSLSPRPTMKKDKWGRRKEKKKTTRDGHETGVAGWKYGRLGFPKSRPLSRLSVSLFAD